MDNQAYLEEDPLLYWKKSAEKHDFDPDTYIVEPQRHYSRLDELERDVVHASEFFRCRGKYDLADNTLPDMSQGRPSLVGERMWKYLAKGKVEVVTSRPDSNEAQEIAESLLKSCLIICNVLGRLEFLEFAGFCREGYSMLVERPKQNLAEVVRLPKQTLEDLTFKLEVVIDEVCSGLGFSSIRDIGDYLRYRPHISVALLTEDITGLEWSLIGQSRIRTNNFTLMELRMTALMLDLALVAYMGSHGSQFGHYIKEELESIDVSGTKEYPSHFRCSQKRLACLDEFLDSNKVWVFECWETKSDPQLYGDGSPGSSQQLSILTDMEDFADLWGPVWTVPAGDNAVQQYNVSKGFIARVRDGAGDDSHDIDGAVNCHWYSWASVNGGEAKIQLTSAKFSKDKGTEDFSIPKGRRLCIGASLRLNKTCSYTLDEYESEYAQTMVPLGTTETVWRLDTRTIGVSAAQYIGITVSGTQKRIPSTTLKDRIWNKLSQNPTRANPCFLHQFLVVEISHCTGNSRRRRLKDLLYMERVRLHLQYFHPDWDRTQWGVGLLSLPDGDDDALMAFWMTHQNKREEIGELLCHVLDLLHKTGPLTGGKFAAAYFTNHEELCVKVDISLNDWAKPLRDSSSTAVYAIVNGVCLKYDTRGEITSHRAPITAHTVFQTQIALGSGQGGDLIKLNPKEDVFRQVSRSGSDIELRYCDTPQALASTLLHRPMLTADEIQMLSRKYTGVRLTAYIQSSKESHHGWKDPRVERAPSRRDTQIVSTHNRQSPIRREIRQEDSEISLAGWHLTGRPNPNDIPTRRDGQPTNVDVTPPMDSEIETQNRGRRGSSRTKPQIGEQSSDRRANADGVRNQPTTAQGLGLADRILKGNRARRRIENERRRDQDEVGADDDIRNLNQPRTGRETQSNGRVQSGVDIRPQKATKSSCI
ncbi:hypothetical protein F5882DRAFT_482064 [Hyaloscypha sp. PMI_1271]|nr:hypothetical protein F5882DRAFT_482064 [Hyaloscypha sp. PMI_1271]